jgi:hypothetical protein
MFAMFMIIVVAVFAALGVGGLALCNAVGCGGD